MSSPSFVPLMQLVMNVTNAEVPTITTLANHGYATGQTIMLVVPKKYGMDIGYREAKITVTGLATFTLDVSTLLENPFVLPAAPYTPAHCCNVSGETDNIAT